MNVWMDESVSGWRKKEGETKGRKEGEMGE